MIILNKGTLKLLDCTLRDGGQCLESNHKHGFPTPVFTDQEKRQIAENVRDSGADIIEIGCMTETTGKNKQNIAIYENIEEISAFLPHKKNKNQIYTGIFVDPDVPAAHVPQCSEEFIDGVRIILRYSELKKSLDFCAMLSKKGYKVFIQPMLTMRYTDSDIQMLIDYSNNMNAYALYIVDSFGYMNESDVKLLYEKYAAGLNQDICIGFHAHNNMENALINVRYFVENLIDRDCIIDACAMGMGQGAGNLQTEVAVNYLNSKFGSDYCLDKILNVCDILEKFRSHDMESWGYSTLRFIPAIHKAAYKYAVAMRKEYNMTLSEINYMLTDIPDNLRHRYTPENLNELFKLRGYKKDN